LPCISLKIEEKEQDFEMSKFKHDMLIAVFKTEEQNRLIQIQENGLKALQELVQHQLNDEIL